MTMELREEARLREAEREEMARRRERFARDVRALAALPEGGRLFRWLIGQGDIFAEDYLPGYPGAYRAGRKAAALRVWNALREHLGQEEFVAVTGGGGYGIGVGRDDDQ